MSIIAAKTHAMNAQAAASAEQKLTYLAQAVYELARSLEDMEHKIAVIHNAVLSIR
jgi:hypothetical protein